MRKKKICAIATVVVLALVTIVVLTACNPYKWDSIGGGDASSTVISNGGYYVEQGGYAYFINGYEGEVETNEWGDAYQQTIMRAELNEDGTVNNDTAQIVVPLSIYNESANGGFAIFGEWIYYATPNTDEDTDGSASTTHTNFMRTKIDGSVTQLIATVASRSYEYLFTPTRVLYYDSSSSSITVYYFDFSAMSVTKSSSNSKGVTAGTLISNATSVVWGYDPSREADTGATVYDYVFYTEDLTDDSESYEFGTMLRCIRYDGTDQRTLYNKTSFITEDYENNYINEVQSWFEFTLIDIYYGSDTEVYLYYTKDVEIDSTTYSVGLYYNIFTIEDGMPTSTEVQLTQNEVTTIFPMGVDGILVLDSSSYYYVQGVGTDYELAGYHLVVGTSSTVQAVIDGYVYYTYSNVLYRINFDLTETRADGSPNAEIVVSAGVTTDWLNLEIIDKGDNGIFLYYFDSEDYDYLAYIRLDDFDGEELVPTMIGLMTEEDAEAKAEEEEEE